MPETKNTIPMISPILPPTRPQTKPDIRENTIKIPSPGKQPAMFHNEKD